MLKNLSKKIILVLLLLSMMPVGVFAQGVVNTARQQPTVENVQSRTDLTQPQKNERSANLQTDAQAAAAKKELETKKAIANACDFSSNTWISCNIAEVGAWLLALTANILFMAGNLFDWVLEYSLNMKQRLEDFKFVTIGWAILRDVTNLIYIFILLFIAINVIIGNSGYGNKSMISRVIITAILVNFSLFGAKVVIDATNIASLQFYNLIKPANSSNSINLDVKSITGQFMNLFNLQSIYSDKLLSTNQNSSVIIASLGKTVGSTGVEPTQDDYWFKIAYVSFIGILFILAVSVVFFAGAFLFITRTIWLFFIMLFSSLAVASRVLPATEQHFKKWWKMLFDNAIFAPIFMGLIYIFIAATTGKNAGVNFAALILKGDGIGGLVMFFMYLAFLVGILLISKSLGIKGGEYAHSFAEKYISPKAVGRGIAVRTGGALATTIAENRITKGLSRFVPGAGRALAKVGDVTGYNDLRKKRDTAMNEKFDYYSSTSPQRRWETDESYKKRQSSAKVRALSTLGLNEDGSRRKRAFVGDQLARLMLDGKSYKKLRSAKAKEAIASAKNKERSTKHKMALVGGIEKMTGIKFRDPVLDSQGQHTHINGVPQYNKIKDPEFQKMLDIADAIENNAQVSNQNGTYMLGNIELHTHPNLVTNQTGWPDIVEAYEDWQTSPPNQANQAKKNYEQKLQKLKSQIQSYKQIIDNENAK